jgi:PAS domain S-box-containing protein
MLVDASDLDQVDSTRDEQRRKVEAALSRKVAEQAALYELTDRLQRAASRADMYDAALGAVAGMLDCERASVMLPDDAGVMRFVAWRGLSATYRAAVDGRSPWSPEVDNPQPVWIEDVAEADLPGTLLAALKAEGIAALSFVPLVAGGRLIGKFTSYHAAPHRFSASETALAVVIGRQLAFNLARVAAEEVALEKEAEINLVMNATPFMMVRCGRNLRYRYVSPAYARKVGRDAAEFIGRPIDEIIGAENLAAVRPHIDKVLGGERVEWESEMRYATGGRCMIQGSYLPERDGHGSIVGWVASLVDVTARDAAGQAARRLASIVESSDDAIVSKDLNGIVTSWNVGAERLFGYSADEIIGQPITMVIPDDRQDEEPHILSRLRRGERVDHFETIRRRKDGRPIDVSLTISPVRNADGKIVGASKIARDVSDRRKAEADLRASEQRLQDLLAAIPAAIYTTDAEGTITYFNEAAIDFAGRRPDIGRDKWCVSARLYRPDGTPLSHDECPMAVALKEGRAIRDIEAVAERPDGTRVPFIPYPTPLRDALGGIVGGINMLVDISERKQAETHQRLLVRELNHRVKNNMQVLHVLLNSALRGTQSPDARAVLEDAGRRVAAMAAAHQVLYATPSGVDFAAAEFLEIVCRTAQQTFAGKASIRVEVAQGVLWNDAASPLALILNELITNAVKHGLQGQSGEIRVGLKKNGGDFELYVEDDGPGFTPASRKHSSGLSLVQALARQLKGKLEIGTTGATRCAVLFSERVHAEAST